VRGANGASLTRDNRSINFHRLLQQCVYIYAKQAPRITIIIKNGEMKLEKKNVLRKIIMFGNPISYTIHTDMVKKIVYCNLLCSFSKKFFFHYHHTGCGLGNTHTHTHFWCPFDQIGA
jgi:hypothetical protein